MTRLPEIVAFALLCGVTVGQDYTKEFYDEAQYRPILTYECYRTGVTLEPEGTVNFTILWDGTESNNDKAIASMWYAPDRTVDQYTINDFKFEYDTATTSIKLTSNDLQETFKELIEPHGSAFYMNITIPSQNNRVVLKLYDIDSSCGNAAFALKAVDPQRELGFIFSRDVPEPTQDCTKELLCVP